MVLTVAVLGAVEARRDGDRLSVPAGKTTELLVRLALDAGSRVRADVAARGPLDRATAGRNTLQSKVSQLRRALGDKDLVVGAGDAYRSLSNRAASTPSAWSSLAARGVLSAAGGRRATALAKASEGLACSAARCSWTPATGPRPHRARLEEVRLGLLEDVMAARVDLGAGGELVGELEALVEQHPLRERLWASLITALYRAGRQADALAAYTRVRRLLVDELGVEPGPDLRALEQQVLRQSAALGGTPALRRVTTPGNLPRGLTPRSWAGTPSSRALAALVDEHRLVTRRGTGRRRQDPARDRGGARG